MKVRLFALFCVCAFFCACATMESVVKSASDAAAQKGYISRKQAEGIKKTTTAFRKSAEEISESEEYYIGRAVAAQILTRYPPYEDTAANRYVQTVGQAVAMSSDRPTLYNGYHFQILDSEEVNAFAAPGGFVFVTRGLLRLLDGEDQLAAVLGHELAHCSLKHGLKTIKAARLTSAFSVLATEAGKTYSGEEVAKLTEAFEGALDDVVQSLVVKGYAREKEFEADSTGAMFAQRANYDPKALEEFIKKLGSSPGGSGLNKTHPSNEKRLEELASRNIARPPGYQKSRARGERFSLAMGRLR